MAYHTTLSVPRATWTEATNALVTAIRLQNMSLVNSIFVQATVDGTPPTSTAGAMILPTGQVIPSDLTLAQLFPGIVTTTGRVWLFSADSGLVSVSHA